MQATDRPRAASGTRAQVGSWPRGRLPGAGTPVLLEGGPSFLVLLCPCVGRTCHRLRGPAGGKLLVVHLFVLCMVGIADLLGGVLVVQLEQRLAGRVVPGVHPWSGSHGAFEAPL